ncbi:hypothetical protein JKP88DRAFT_217211 [Tribonema minus]|uniref:Uncharacterized protein n=1 Tax=Tribonema minus TaxID=303371 RepID=A0A836CMQ8_9STRA|nr:hypothetical protein JKP88DRAFT_217211 [Tribonema minus]
MLLVCAGAGGRVALLKWAHTRGILRWAPTRDGGNEGIDWVVEEAVASGRLEVLAWMLAAGILQRPAELEAALMRTRGTQLTVFNPACVAAAHGRLRLLQWLRAHGFLWTRGICAAAACNKRIGVLEWALANGCEDQEKSICRVAAEGAHMTVAVLDWAEARGCKCAFHSSACRTYA